MDGLEAVEISLAACLNIIDFRIDANTYKKDYIKTEKLLKMKESATIEQISLSVQNFGAYSLCNLINFFDSGIPFLMTENIRHNYIDWNIHKYVDSVSHELLYKSHCYRNQILVTMAGEYLGRVAVYDKDEVCSSNQAIAKVTLKSGISPYIVSTFLNSKHGQNQINRLKTITGQPNINMSLIKSLSCPVFSEDFQSKIEQTVTSSHKKLEESKQLYKEAEELLLAELGLLDFVPNSDNVAIKSFSDSFSASGRLDSEYYQPKYDDIINKIKNYHNGCDVLNNFVDNYSTGYPFSSDSYVDDGVPLIRITNIKNGMLDIENAAKIPVTDITLSPKDVATSGDVLISMSGTIGSSCVIPQNTTAVVNQRIMRISPKNISLNVFPLLINSIVGQSQLERIGTGGVQTNISSGDILSILVPNLDGSIQEQIEAKIKQSFALKEQSKQLLDLAKRAVEVAIEESEQQAFHLINTVNTYE